MLGQTIDHIPTTHKGIPMRYNFPNHSFHQNLCMENLDPMLLDALQCNFSPFELYKMPNNLYH